MNNVNTLNVNNTTFGIVPSQDFKWLADNTSCPIAKLWAISWLADPFGNRLVQLPEVNVGETALKKARKVLRDSELFKFEPKKDDSDSRKTKYWLVKNLHGKRTNDSNPDKTASNNQEELQGRHKNLEVAETTLEVAITTSILSQSLTEQASQDSPIRDQDLSSNNQEKEINNINTLRVENKYNKPDIYTPRAREDSEGDSRCDEPTLNATAHKDIKQEKECLSVLSLNEMSSIVKQEYPGLLPQIREGFRRKALRLLEDGVIKLYVFDLLEGEIQAIQAIIDRNEVTELIRFVEEFECAIVAKFSFDGRQVKHYSLCG